MKKYLFLMGALVMGLTFIACGDDKSEGGNGDPTEVKIADSEYDALINQYVDGVVLPTYKDLVAGNTKLYDAVVAFGNNPSDNAFSKVANAWLEAREPWESSEAFLFGPVADLGLDPNMDSWPLDQEAIVGLLNSQQWNDLEWSGDYDEEDEEIEAVQSVRGFHTLEFLTFRNGVPRTLNDVAEDSEAANVVYNSSNASAWANYMKAVALLLKNDATDLNNAWNNGYAATFKSHNGSKYPSAISCVEEIIDGCIDIASEVGSSKIGEPYDLYVSGKKTEALYAVESWYSWHSRDDYTNNIYSIRNAYYGSRNNSVNSNSLSAIVAKYNPSLDTRVKSAINTAATAIQAIPQPFRNNIDSKEASAAMDACSALESVLNELKSYLVNHTK